MFPSTTNNQRFLTPILCFASWLTMPTDRFALWDVLEELFAPSLFWTPYLVPAALIRHDHKSSQRISSGDFGGYGGRSKVFEFSYIHSLETLYRTKDAQIPSSNRVAETRQALKPDRQAFKSPLTHLLHVWCWVSHFMCLSLNKVAKQYLPYSIVVEVTSRI